MMKSIIFLCISLALVTSSSIREKRQTGEKKQFIKDAEKEITNFIDKFYGGSCKTDNQCMQFISSCHKDSVFQPMGECRLNWYSWLILGLIVLLVVGSCAGCCLLQCCCQAAGRNKMAGSEKKRRCSILLILMGLLAVLATALTCYCSIYSNTKVKTDVTEILVLNGQSLHKAINNLNRVDIYLALDKIESSIENLNFQTVKGRRQKRSVSRNYDSLKSLENLEIAKNNLVTLQATLNTTAEETITKVDSILNLLQENALSKQTEALEKTTRTMSNLTTTSDTTLVYAWDLLKDVNSRLSVIDAEMIILQQKYDAELSSKKFELDNLPPPRRSNVNICDLCREYIKQKKRVQSLCIRHTSKSVIKAENELLNLLATRVINEQKEIEIRKKYTKEKATLETDIKRISSVTQNLQMVLADIQEIDENILKEQILVVTWRSQLSHIIDNVMYDPMEVIDFDVDPVITMFEDLRTACLGYIAKKIPTDFRYSIPTSQ